MSTTASQALAAVRAKLEAVIGESIPLYWQGDDAPVLPDEPVPFAYIVFNNLGSGSVAAFGGGRGRNLYRNRASVEAYVFAPLGAAPGMQSVMDYAETIASALRSFRNAAISCFAADVIPVGPGSSISPPGFQSEVSNYQAAIAEIDLQFDQIG